jgi:hypothetical protein
MPKPVAPPLWLSGQLPANQKYSNNRTPGIARTTVTAEEVGAREGPVAEAADAAAAAAGARTRLCLEKAKKRECI